MRKATLQAAAATTNADDGQRNRDASFTQSNHLAPLADKLLMCAGAPTWRCSLA